MTCAAAAPLRASEEIQGNVLAPFPEEHQAFLMLSLADPGGARRWLRRVLPGITATAQVNAAPVDGEEAVFRSLGLSHGGLGRLSPAALAGLESFEAFRQGPAARAGKLRDRGPGAPERWNFGGPNQAPIDALLTLASTSLEHLEEALEEQRRLAGDGVEVVHVERGGTLPGAMAGREHFGFRDGISQPAVLGHDHPAAGDPDHPLTPAGEFVLGHPRHGAAGLGPPLPCPAWMHDGSFQVFKRFHQDVPGWRAQLAAASAELAGRGVPMSPDELAARLIGRWPSGAPLAHSPEADDGAVPGGPGAVFDYEDDPLGIKTPRFSHIRKMYPRSNLVVDREWHRLIRRSVPFGPIYDPEAGPGSDPRFDPDTERGLLMNSFMASIEQQFEFLLRGWAHDPDFFEADDGPDPLIGEDAAPVTLRCPLHGRQSLSLQRHVHATGAVYAFAPSLRALRSLAAGEL
jgi:Dyp-type peroxidase family